MRYKRSLFQDAKIIMTCSSCLIMAGALISCAEQRDARFECPSLFLETTTSGEPVSDEDFREIRAILGDFPRENAILEARILLSKKYPDVSDAMAVDYFAAAYCQTFKDDAAMSDREKKDRVQRWNRIVTTTILESNSTR